MQLHKHDWKPIVPYARFPAGLPPGFLTTPPPPQQPVVAQKHESPKPAPKPWPVPESPADQHRFATHLGAGWAFHEQQGGTIEQGGVGFIGGIDARVQWPLFVSTRVLIAHRDVSADVSQGDFAKSGESFDLALLIGLQGHKKWFRPGFGIGPAAVGASVGDFTDLDFSVAFQGEVMVDVSPNVAAGVVLAYDKNDKRDFYVVALGLRFVFW